MSKQRKPWPKVIDPGSGIGPVEFSLMDSLLRHVYLGAEKQKRADELRGWLLECESAARESVEHARCLVASLRELGVDVTEYLDMDEVGLSGDVAP